MSNPDKQRLHPVAIVVTSVQILQGLLPAALIGMVSGDTSVSLIVLLVASVVSFVVASGLGLLRWWRFRWWLEADGMRIEKGMVFRKEVFIPTRNVQAIDTSAGIFQRPFGLVSLKVKTGTSGTQANLSALGREAADRIRQNLRRGPVSETEEPTEAETTIARLSPKQLMLAATTSGQIGIILSGVAWLFSQLQEVFSSALEYVIEVYVLSWGSQIMENPEGLFAQVVTIAMVAVVGLLVVWLLSVAGAVLRYGGFSASLQGDALVLRHGILNRNQVTIERKRIQAVRIVEDVLAQPFGYGTLYIESIGHADEQGRSAVLHPCLHRSEWRDLLRQAAPQLAVEPELSRPPRRALLRFVLRSLAPIVALVGVAFWFSSHAVWGLGLLVPALLLAVARWRDNGAGWTSEVAVVQSRGIQRVTAHIPRDCVQSASQRSTFFQRRRDLAHGSLVAASGKTGKTFTAHDLEAEHADGLLEWASEATTTRRAPAETTASDGHPNRAK